VGDAAAAAGVTVAARQNARDDDAAAEPVAGGVPDGDNGARDLGSRLDTERGAGDSDDDVTGRGA
jgi:hypothetical protein